jgi:D-lyxose ketol-isomerase
MKRSEINRYIDHAIETFHKHGVKLPHWAYWSLEHWQHSGIEADEIRRHHLGWNITDFGSGEFEKMGLLIFVARNGCLEHDMPVTTKTYAEKYFIVRPEQVTPWHFHWVKTEDLINRAGGRMQVELAWANPNNDKEMIDKLVYAQVDGITKVMPAGSVLTLLPGESVTLPPRLCHKFYGHKDGPIVFAGEISSLNDDSTDNCFLKLDAARSPIIEDEAAKYILANEYPKVKAAK